MVTEIECVPCIRIEQHKTVEAGVIVDRERQDSENQNAGCDDEWQERGISR